MTDAERRAAEADCERLIKRYVNLGDAQDWAAVAALYEQLARGRKGIAVVAARDERCSECHVRMRPQVFVHVRQNNGIIQCDSCQRILYYVPPAPPAEAAAPSPA